jgi:energy-converting hydrogenase Eha subunit H
MKLHSNLASHAEVEVSGVVRLKRVVGICNAHTQLRLMTIFDIFNFGIFCLSLLGKFGFGAKRERTFLYFY